MPSLPKLNTSRLETAEADAEFHCLIGICKLHSAPYCSQLTCAGVCTVLSVLAGASMSGLSDPDEPGEAGAELPGV